MPFVIRASLGVAGRTFKSAMGEEGTMQGWSVARLLYEGETLEADVPVGERRVVVTSHRVLALPADEDEAYRAIERPNVRSVETGTLGGDRWLAVGVRALVGAVALAVVGVVLQRAGLGGVTIPNTGSAGRFGAGGFTAALRTFFALFGVLDVVAFALAGVCAVAAVGFFALAWHAQSPCLAFDLAGEETLRVHGPMADLDAAAAAVRRALAEEEEASPPRS